MAHAQKPDFAFRRNGRVHLNRRGRQLRRLLAAEVCGIRGSNAGYTMFRGSVKSTGYPTPFASFRFTFPSRASPGAITFQLESTRNISFGGGVGWRPMVMADNLAVCMYRLSINSESFKLLQLSVSLQARVRISFTLTLLFRQNLTNLTSKIVSKFAEGGPRWQSG